MNIHYVNLHTLPIGTLLGPWRVLLLWGTGLASCVHVRGDDPLHMEVLLVVGSILFCVLGTRIVDHSTASVGVLLDILGGMVRSTTHATTPTYRLIRGLVVALQRLLLRMETTTILINVRAVGVCRHTLLLLRHLSTYVAILTLHVAWNSGGQRCVGARFIWTIHEASLLVYDCIARTLLDASLKHITMLYVLHLLITARLLLLVRLLLAWCRANITNVTVLIAMLTCLFLELRKALV